MRPRPNRKQIETNYEIQFSINLVLKDKIEKKSIKNKHKKQLEFTMVNLSNLSLKS
jgi:hypothetical protein